MQERGVLLGVQARGGSSFSISAHVPTKLWLANSKVIQTLKLKVQPYNS